MSVTQQRYRQTSLALLAALLLSTTPHASSDNNALQLPDMGESIDSFMSLQQEQEMGKAFMRSVRRSLPIIDDPQLARYIQSLGQRLSTHGNQAPQDFHFFIVDDTNINAFAGPGGYIGIHSGLILATQNEDELAAVIAHELAHVTQRHLARAYQSANNMTLPLTAAIIAAIVLGGQAELGQLSEATLASAVAGSAQQQINFTRSNEQEADRIGMQTLVRAGYTSNAMQRFFKRLLQASQYQEDSALEFLRTHPLTTNRIAGSNDPLATPSPDHSGGQKKIPGISDFELIQARIRVLTSTETNLLAPFFTSQTSPTSVRQYGLALTAIRQRQYTQARNILKKLIKQAPDKITYTLANIENETRNGSVSQALAIIEKTLPLYPDDHPLTLLYARALLKDQQYNKARSLLRQHLHTIKPTPVLYALLAEAEGKSGDRTATHQAMAELHFLNGDNSAALKQIQLALQQGEDLNHNEKLRLQSRLKEIQQIIAAEARH